MRVARIILSPTLLGAHVVAFTAATGLPNALPSIFSSTPNKMATQTANPLIHFTTKTFNNFTFKK
jgi:hypothetical protein